MNTQDKPVKDQDTPFIEEHNGHIARQGNVPQQPGLVTARPDEQDARPYTPVPEQPPVWTGYAHGNVGGSPQATITLSTSTGSINLHQGVRNDHPIGVKLSETSVARKA